LLALVSNKSLAALIARVTRTLAPAAHPVVLAGGRVGGVERGRAD